MNGLKEHLPGSLAGPNLHLNPNPSGIPGSSQVQTLMNGVAWGGLVLCVLGIVLGGATLAYGNIGNSSFVQSVGKQRIVLACVGAAGIGLATSLVGFMYSLFS
jgi:hypothetical protein